MMKFLINNPPQPAKSIKGAIEADYRLAIITAEASNPIVIFTQPLSDFDHFAVHVSRRLRDTAMHRIDPPPLEVLPGLGGSIKTWSNFR